MFFPVGTNGSGTATRDECVVPVGKALFFPLFNAFIAHVDCTKAPATVCDSNDTALEVWNDLQVNFAFSISTLQASIDGVPVRNLDAEAWAVQRTPVCRMLGLNEQPAPVLERLAQELEDAYGRTATNLPLNEAVHIEHAHGRHELVLSGLDKLDEPPSLMALRTLVAQRLPRVELPELLLEVQAWTGFASDFTHIN
jgi:hypothetical protein